MSEYYQTIAASCQGLYKEKNSKFISFAYPVNTEEEVKEILQSLKKEYYDARHICHAFIIGAKKDFFRSHDAGEPAHTAGDPILHAIKSYDLTNVLVVVIRYFGGTKLGVGGLIGAYRAAAEQALSKASIVKDFPKTVLNLQFSYQEINTVMKKLKEVEALFMHQELGETCTATVIVKSSDTIKLQDWQTSN